ncbi:BgMFREP4 [Biomphalaria glabrata]|nr:hypothetical protein BgiMline_033229 [Biomphalaria glabrata]
MTTLPRCFNIFLVILLVNFAGLRPSIAKYEKEINELIQPLMLACSFQTSNVDPDLGPGAQLTSITHVDKKLQISCKCLPKPTSCRDVVSTQDRIVVTLASGLEVMCDTKTDGGGWIIFQRRIHGDVDFYKNWQEYRDGFGDYNIGEFYLGNENIFNLTSSRKYELRFDLEYENKKYFAHYSDFKLLDENNNYKLIIGSYSGTAGDSMKRHVNKFFYYL